MNRSFSFQAHDDSSLTQRTPSPPVFPGPQVPDSPPPIPSHARNTVSSYRLPPLDTRPERTSQNLGRSTSTRTQSTITPGADYLGETSVGGGISGVALGVASHYQRESGLEAIRETERLQQNQPYPQERGFQISGTDTPYVPEPPPSNHRPSDSSGNDAQGRALNTSYGEHRMSQGRDPFASPAPSRRSNPFDDAPTPGQLTPRVYPSTTSIPMNDYPSQDAYAISRSHSDNPYNRYSSAWDPRVSRADIDPDEIEDDDDMRGHPGPNGSQSNVPYAAAAGGAAATGGVLGALGGLVGRKAAPGGSARDASGNYGPVGAQQMPGSQAEKSEWLDKETSGRKRLRWLVIVIIALVIIGAIVGGIIGGMHRSRSSGSTPASAAEDDGNGDLDKNSDEIKKLMGNTDLHKVLPGVDYTPFNAQYPECLSNMPSQNNVTRDVAVLSQLTNTIRLYGTDCNQTEMVIHAVDRLELTGFKIWLGVWLDGNQTTNDRGIDTMHDILSKHGADPFAGVVVGNEVLYREEVTEEKLGEILTDTKKYLSDNKIDLPVSTSDLGDAWTSSLAAKVDVVMANVHPFFAGVTADKAAGWTYNFWSTKNVPLTQGTSTRNVVSEVGWPSAGGIHCGQSQTTCTDGSKAGIDQMNEFMSTFICQSLANGTDFFWFEAFDEPWKQKLNEKGKEWEDKWGLMDSGRKLKPGLKIPDCGGKGI